MPIHPVENQRLYRQIADQISGLIASGEFEEATRLPSERDLAVQLGVSRPSVREALIALEVEGKVDVRVGCICGCKFWLNGQLLGLSEVYHSGESIDQYRGSGVLKPGRNLVVIKVCQNNQPDKWAQDWHFQLRVCDAIGTAVHSER